MARPVIVCFAGSDWDGNPHSRHHLMRRFAGSGWEVLWVEGIPMRSIVFGEPHELQRSLRKLTSRAGLRTVAPHLHVMRALPIPPAGRLTRRTQAAAVRLQIRRALRRIGATGPRLAWFSLPNAAALRGRLGEVGGVFYYQDRYDAFSHVDSRWLRARVGQLARSCELVIASSAALADDLRDLGAEPVVVPHGVDAESFRARVPPPADLEELERPLVGYVGVVDDFVSPSHLKAVADRLNEGTVVLVGPLNVSPESLMHPRIALLGRRPYDAIPGYVQAFDCCLIPFSLNRLTQAINPIKLREYLAAGRPVVSTPLPEVQRYSKVVEFGEDPVEFASAVIRVLGSGADAEDRVRDRKASIAAESWDAVAAQLEPLLANTVKDR